MDRGRTAAALLALAACIACSAAAPHSTSSDQTALEVSEGPSSGCYYNFQHYGEGDRIMTNEPCLNCTCHNRMLMCYLRVCPFTKPIGQDCTIEKRADQCCPIVTCPDVPVDLLTSTSTSSPAEYGATGLGKLDKYGCSINGKYFPEGSKVPPSPNKPCEHCYCIRNMTTCVMQECTLHVDGCTPIYHKDVCCPVRYSCDHPEDEIPLLDDMTTTIRPTPGFLLTTTTIMPVTQPSQNCVHDDQIVPDGALIKTEKACEHCYCMKGDIVCVVQECGTPMENEGKNCTSLPPRQGQCCPDTYICEGDEISTEETTEMQELTTTPPRRFSVEGSGYRLEPDETYTETPSFVTDEEGSGEEHLSTVPVTEKSFEKPTQTKETLTPHDTIYDISTESVQMTNIPEVEDFEKHEDKITTELISTINTEEQVTTSSKEYATNVKEDDHLTTSAFVTLSEEIVTTETPTLHDVVTTKVEKTTRVEDILDEATLKEDDLVPEKEHKVPVDNEYVSTTPATVQDTKTTLSHESTTLLSVEKLHTEEIVTPEIETQTLIDDIESDTYTTTPKEKFDVLDTTSINPVENEIQESDVPIYSPGRIPGEGDCLLNSITYQNNSSVPSSNNCHSSCRCISSIIKCDPIVCSAPPEYMSDCQPIYDSPESCCPTYVCSTKETIPPESHNQMSESESVKPILASECNSPDCESLAPSDCSNNDCVPKDKVSSQDTADSCDGEKCKVDLSLEKHPELHRDAPVECSAENGCNKPLDTQSGNDCSDGNCKLEPALECTGSDCGHEIIKDTTPAALITTSHEYPALELTEKSDTTDKIEIIHDAEKEIETSTQGLHIETIPVEEHITEAIKSSTEIPQTESSQSQDTTFSHEITETPAHGTTLSNNLYTEHSAVSETESDLNKQQQSTEPIEQGVTIESDVIHKDVHEATMDRTTSRITEQAITDTETVTEGAYETKPVEPVTQEIGVTYSPEPTKETIIPTDDQANEINVDITKHHTDSIQETTESVLKETTTAKQTKVPQEDTSMFDISGSTISDTTITEKIESSTNSYPAATESDHKEITKLFEHDTETQNSLGYEDKDKVTESVSVITESDMKITDVTESSEYKPISDNTGTEMTDEIYTELPITEVTKLIEPKLDTTSIPKVTEKSDQDRATERIQEQTEISVDEHKEVTTESVTTDSKFIYEKQTEVSVDEHKEVTTESVTTDSKFIYEKQTELSVDEHKEVTTESVPTDSIFIYDKQTTEAQLDSVTSAVLRDKESENTMTEAIPTENIIEGDVTVTVSSEGVQEIHTSIPEIKTTETSTESGYHYEPSSPVFDEKVETTALPVNEVPIKITTESEQDVTSGTIAPEITEKEKQEKELTTTRPHGHDYYTTEESYQASSQTSIDKDLSEKPDITTVSPIHVEEIVTTQNQEEFTSTVKDAISSKVDVQQVAAEVSTVSYHEATTNIVSLTETVLPTDSYDTVNPPVDTQPETDAILQTTEASIKYEDTQTTESEIKVNVGFDDKLSTTTESNVYNVEPQTEKIESDIPTKEVTYTEEASTSIPSDEITDKPTKEIEEHEKITEISEIVTVVPEKTEITTTRIIEMDSDTKTPETYTTLSQDVVSDVSTIVPVTSEYGTKEFETETPYISTTSKAIDVIVEMTTVKEVKEETGAEQHSETGSGEEDTATSSPTTTSEVQDFDLNHEISTIEILTSSSSTEKPTKDTSPTKEEQIETTPATIELTTQSNIEIQKETSLSSGIESATAAIDTHNASTEIMSTTQEPEGLEPELVTEKTIKDNTEPLPERNDQQGELPLEASTPYSTQEEISTPHSALSLVTDDSEKEHIEPQTDVASTIPEQEKHTLTTEPLLIEQGLTTTDRFTTKEPEILTTFQQEPAEHDVQTTSSDEKISNTDINKYPEIITEYPEKTTADQITNKDNKIPYPPITEVSQTILPETTVSESQSVTKEATLSQNLYDTTTQKLLEEVTEKEAGLEETTKLPMHYGDKYETTTTLLLETEPERQTNKPTKEELPDTGDYGTTLAEEVDSEKDSDVTKSPSIYTTKQTTEQQTRDQTENVADTSTHIDISHDATTSISPNTITDNEMESQASTEQSIPSKDHYDITTTVPIEKVTEKESEMEISTTSGVSSVPIEEQTEKEILREPSKDKLETTTFVTIEKDLTTPATQDKYPVIEDTTVTKETSDISSYERTTLKSLDEVTEYPSIIKQTVQEDLYQPTISRLPEKDTEKEVDSDIKLVATTLDTSFTTLGASSSTPTNKLPESTDDAQKSTEPAMEYSETTPYLIELQEHTHQSIDELSSKTPIDGESTTEQYISEHPDRGDIPHDVNVMPTSLHEDMDVTTPKEDKSSTTPKYINDEIPTETDQTTAQSPSESPKEEDKYTVLPIETEKPLSTPEIEAHTDKHIPGDYESHKPVTDIVTSTEEVSKVTMPPVFTKPSEESTIHTEEDKPEEKPVESTEVFKPDLNEPSDDLPSPDFSPSGAGGYGQEPDYGDNEDQAFGPGTCRYGGKVYVSAQQIPRDDPCDFCFCFRSDIICLQQSCPPPIHGCHEEPIQGFCCPRYECPVSMATTLNVTTTTTTTTTTLPPHFLPHAYKGAAQRRGCQIKGHTYKVGEVVRASSGPCLHCTCGGDGQMKCDPKACTPEPMLRQMIAAAVSAKRRR